MRTVRLPGMWSPKRALRYGLALMQPGAPQGHFMVRQYHAFNRPLSIRPPGFNGR